MVHLNKVSGYFAMTWKYVVLTCVLSIGLSACDHQQPEHDRVSNRQHSTAIDSQKSALSEEKGSKLADVAGQATLPVKITRSETGSGVLSSEALQYVGRYHVRIPCADPVALCKDQKGEIDYVLNLLQDGTGYRKRVSMGRITLDDRQNTKSFDPDQWNYHAGQQIVVTMPTGGDLYFRVLDQDHLQMDLNTTTHADQGGNKQRLGESFILPRYPYTLTRIVDTYSSN